MYFWKEVNVFRTGQYHHLSDYRQGADTQVYRIDTYTYVHRKAGVKCAIETLIELHQLWQQPGTTEC